MNERTCNRCNTPLSSGQAAYCSHACANRTSAAARSARSRAQPHKQCDIAGCDKPARSRTAGLCPMHYHRVYRYGSLETQRTEAAQSSSTRAARSSGQASGAWPRRLRQPADIRGKRFGTLTVVGRQDIRWVCQCDCGETRLTRTGDLNRYGDNSTCGVKANHLAPLVGYTGAHDRVRRMRGPVHQYGCTSCDRQAQHWSYDHDDPDEIHSADPRTMGIAYSLDSEHYSPRCVPCHKRFDLDRIDGTLHVPA